MYWISNETTLKLREIVQSKEESKILPDATHSLVKLSDDLINFNFEILINYMTRLDYHVLMFINVHTHINHILPGVSVVHVQT